MAYSVVFICSYGKIRFWILQCPMLRRAVVVDCAKAAAPVSGCIFSGSLLRDFLRVDNYPRYLYRGHAAVG